VDVDPVELRRIQQPTIGLLADAGETIKALNAALPKYNAPRASRAQELGALKEELDETFQGIKPQYAYLQAIRSALPDDGIFVEDLTQVGYVSRYAYPVYQPRTHITSNYQGTLGYGFAAALGAKVAQPHKAVVNVCGDGGFMYNVQELATAVQHNIGVVVIVYNDGAYGNVRRMQREDHGGKVIGSDLRNPDFAAMAQTFGTAGVKARNPDEVAAAVREGIKRSGPTLIEVPVVEGEMTDPWSGILMPKVRGR
jgi:acetolactate synthase-1/2/3 large subunit